MRGLLCQHCGRRQELFSTGSDKPINLFNGHPIFGCIPTDPYLSERADAGGSFMEKYPDAQAAKALDLIAEKVMAATQWKTLSGRP